MSLSRGQYLHDSKSVHDEVVAHSPALFPEPLARALATIENLQLFPSAVLLFFALRNLVQNERHGLGKRLNRTQF